MGILKLRGIVLKETADSSSGKRITVLSKGAGKFTLLAKGSKTPKSKFMSAAQMFSYSDFVVFEGKGFLSVTQADIIESFYFLRENIESLYAASYFCELVDKTTPPGMEADESMRLLLKSFQEFSKPSPKVLFIYTVFRLKYLCILGLMPDFENLKNRDSEIYFDEKSGFLFGGEIGGEKISRPALAALSHIFASDIKTVYSFNVSCEILFELEKISCILYLIHIGENTKSEGFLRELLGLA